jgi:NTP pyrophosphatase (non-canonical NTP hydrolase)
MEIREFQALMARTYGHRDEARGRAGTLAWLVEELGELHRAIREENVEAMEEEFADVFAWLASLAVICGIDLERACRKYLEGCPRCHSLPCACDA